MKHAVDVRRRERGGAGVKFLLVLVLVILAANAGFNYIPVAYNGESFKQEMHTAVVNGLAVPRGNPVDTVKARLASAVSEYDLPADTFIDVKMVGNSIQARAAYNKTVHLLPFGLYDHTYQFDHTETPTGYLLKDK
ncbi:MAG: hypothetical protein ACK4S4_08735 [Pyrinomonadaceae bacterium]